MSRGIKTIAFPLISSGIYGYPVKKALQVAITTLSQFDENEIDITLILYDYETYNLAVEVMNEFEKNLKE